MKPTIHWVGDKRPGRHLPSPGRSPQRPCHITFLLLPSLLPCPSLSQIPIPSGLSHCANVLSGPSLPAQLSPLHCRQSSLAKHESDLVTSPKTAFCDSNGKPDLSLGHESPGCPAQLPYAPDQPLAASPPHMPSLPQMHTPMAAPQTSSAFSELAGPQLQGFSLNITSKEISPE